MTGRPTGAQFSHHRTLAATGGVSVFSDAIYQLERELSEAGVVQPVALDWGFRRAWIDNIDPVTDFKLTPLDGYQVPKPETVTTDG